MYDFSLVGNVLSFNVKMMKHIESDNLDRVKDYLCSAFDTFDPIEKQSHPCLEIIKEGVNLLVSNGWNVGVTEWKDIGRQLVIISPDDKYYHSAYERR